MWLGSGPARGREGRCVCVASSTPDLFAHSVATANRPAAHPHTTAPSTKPRKTTGGLPRMTLTGRWRCARAKAPFALAPEQACSSGVDEVHQENSPGRPRARAGKRARRHRPGARSQRETGLKSKQQAAARQCTARHPDPAPSTVPRETPTHPWAAPPARPPGACPSSPSTPRSA